MEFPTDCALFTAVAIDRPATTLPLKPDAIRAEGGTLYINVAGLPYDTNSTFALNLRIADCPIS